MTKQAKKRIFSGIQPSGNLHIGNYLGAIKNWVKLQDEYDSIFCVVDLHAITVPQAPKILYRKTIEMVRAYLACGIDPEKATIFVQSHVPEHSELTWIFNTITKVSEMERMTQFKDKAKKNRESAGMGLLDYPILMAADILLYDSNLVPIGDDQTQHLEICRTIANRFNSKFGETFILPEAYLTREGRRIMGLDDPSKKMSKSAESEMNYIALTDTEEIVRKKIKKAVTDSGSEITYSEDRPALKNLINIYSLLGDKSITEITEKYQGKGYADFKQDLADIIVNFLKPFQERYNALTDEQVLEILHAGAAKVRPLAQAKLVQVKATIGFVV